MATFKYFNVKVLPVSAKREDLIGDDGYRNLWMELYRYTVSAFNAKNALSAAFSLRNDFYISLFLCHSNRYFSYGRFIKFDRPEGLYDSFSGDFVGTVPENASAHRYEFMFVFDHKFHIAAIQYIAGKSPSPLIMEEAIAELMKPVCAKLFPDHYIEVSIITSDTDYYSVFKDAAYFKSAQVEISLSNADDFIDDEVAATQDEMYEKGITNLSHKESSQAGYMSELSKKCMTYIKIARKNGNASLRYVSKKTGKIINYVMKDNPLSMRLHKQKNMSEESFFSLVHDSCQTAQTKSTE